MVFSLLKPPSAKASRPAQKTKFEFDAHILIYRESKLLGHEYMLNATPKTFGERMAVLERESDVSVTYEDAGALAATARSLSIVDGNPGIRIETLQEWQQRDPQTVAQLTGQYLEDSDEGDLALWRI